MNAMHENMVDDGSGETPPLCGSICKAYNDFLICTALIHGEKLPDTHPHIF
jgi:hypothetical protein